MTTTIHTIAGTGEQGYTGDGGRATAARLSEPFMCELDGEGNLYIAEATNHCVRRVESKTGIIRTIAGNGNPGYGGDGGNAVDAMMNQPYALQIADNGDVYVVDRLNAAIRKIDFRSGLISTIAGGPGSDVFVEPNDCFLDKHDGLLVADIQGQWIKRVDLVTLEVTIVAGDGQKLRRGDGGPAREASLLGARAVCMDREGNLYVCEREGNGVRKIDTRGIITTLSGTGERGYTGDNGAALQATWAGPKAIRCDHQGNLLVVDTENHAIRRIDRVTGIVTTVAGGRLGHEGDGGPATRAGLARPHGCSADSNGNMYIADSNNHRIRVVRPQA